MRIKGIRPLVVAASIAIGLAFTTAGAAQAASPQSLTERVVRTVLLSADPQATLASLSTADQALFADSLKHQTHKSRSSGGTFTPSTAQQTAMTQVSPVGASPTVGSTALASAYASCWYHYDYTDYYDFGIHDGATWMQLNWCASGGSITSWSVPIAGGTGYAGNSYNGIVGSGALNVGWEVRQYKEFSFDYGPAYAYPCEQIRGGATGQYSTRYDSCNLS